MAGRIGLRAFLAVSWAIGLAVIFLQIERGTGNLAQVLLFATFDLLLVAALACGLLLVVRRRGLAIVAASALVLLVYLASAQKMRYSAMAAQAHDVVTLLSAWDLVAPYARPVVATAVAVLALLVAWAVLERPRRQQPIGRLRLALAAVVLFAACAVIDDRLPKDDHRLFAAGEGPKIALFFRSIYESPALEPVAFPELAAACCTNGASHFDLRFRGAVKPNLVMVLQESTFSPAILRGYASPKGFLLDGSAPLRVHVRGGGTWVEEFSVLHGIPATAYGADYLQINWLAPANRLGGRLAPLLERQGYRTATVYPTDGHTLGSEALHRSLGVRNFVPCSEIAGCENGRNWTDTPDSAMFDGVLDLLAEDSRPNFVFTATMRQHSPHASRYPLSDNKPAIMAEYHRRLALSDSEAARFIEALGKVRRPTIVLMFGDHIPSHVVAAFEDEAFVADPHTTFFNLYDESGAARAAELMARHPGVAAPDSAFLDALLLDFAGFGGDYIDAKLALMRRCGGVFCDPQAAGEQDSPTR
jgi:hypothetical protein